MLAVDTNILVYAHSPQESHHAAALAALTWLADRARPWAVTVSSLVEFTRICSHSRLLRRSIDETCAALDAIAAAPGCRIIGLGGSDWLAFRDAVIEGRAAGNLAFDAHIVAACRSHGVAAVLTEDLDFARFRSIRALRLTDDWQRVA